MSKESINPDQLFTVSSAEFATQYRPLTPAELEAIGESPIAPPAVPEEIRNKQEAFLMNIFEYWDNSTAPNAKISTEERLPAGQNWQALEKDINPDKFGELILNPETQGVDFEKAKVFIPDLSAFEGKKLSEVAEHLVATYGGRYYLPGLEYEQWVFDHQDADSLPAGPEFDILKKELTDHYCFFFGSTLRYSSGHWSVPYAYWNGSAWYRHAYWLGNVWYSYYRVVLLER